MSSGENLTGAGGQEARELDEQSRQVLDLWKGLTLEQQRVLWPAMYDVLYTNQRMEQKNMQMYVWEEAEEAKMERDLGNESVLPVAVMFRQVTSLFLMEPEDLPSDQFPRKWLSNLHGFAYPRGKEDLPVDKEVLIEWALVVGDGVVRTVQAEKDNGGLLEEAFKVMWLVALGTKSSRVKNAIADQVVKFRDMYSSDSWEYRHFDQAWKKVAELTYMRKKKWKDYVSRSMYRWDAIPPDLFEDY